MEAFVIAILLFISVVTLLAATFVLVRRPSRGTIISGVIAVWAVVVGWALIFYPSYKAAGATCLINPTTQVFGYDGSADRVDEMPVGPSRDATRACIDQARLVTGGAAALIVVPAAVFGGILWAGRRRDAWE